MQTPKQRLSPKLQEKLTQAQYPKRPTLYYLRVEGGEGMRRYLAQTMDRKRYKQASGKLRRAVSILTEKDMIIHVSTEGLTLESIKKCGASRVKPPSGQPQQLVAESRDSVFGNIHPTPHSEPLCEPVTADARPSYSIAFVAASRSV